MIATHHHDVLLSDTEIQRFLIAMRDGTPVGTLILFVTPKEDCITVGITIASAHQRKGYAKEILTALCNLAKETYPTLDLIALIHPDNTPSIRLFEALGFRFQLHAESINSLVYVR
jgi:RimJ/RimL family protein N-acetyltransferase